MGDVADWMYSSDVRLRDTEVVVRIAGGELWVVVKRRYGRKSVEVQTEAKEVNGRSFRGSTEEEPDNVQQQPGKERWVSVFAPTTLP